MKASELEAIWRQTPFRRFTLHADSRSITVDHPGQFFISPHKDLVVVVPREGGMQIVDLEHISSVDLRPRARRPRPAEPA